MKIVVLDGYLVNFDGLDWDLGPGFQVHWYDDTPPEKVVDRIGNAEIVFVNRVRLTREIFQACPHLKFVGLFATGCNQVDLPAASEAGITVCNVPEYSTDAVAQQTMALLLNIATQAYAHNAYIHQGGWRASVDPAITRRPMFELAGKTIGIIGFGAIGRRVATLCEAFGMKVLAYRRTPPSSQDRFPLVPLDTLLEKSDIISLHCPLNEDSKELINRNTLAKMKSGTILLNTARGGILNEGDVLEALDSGRLYMLGTDVLSQEPPSPKHPFISHPKVFCTPHVGWLPKETRQRVLDICKENLLCWVKGTPIHVVNSQS